jgi:hypothetical protein
MRNGVATAPVFVDSTIYQMDNALLGGPPSPYASQATGVGATFHYNHANWPTINTFFGEQNYNGSFSLPNQAAIVNRNTFDTMFNVGTTPVVRMGNTHFVLNPGIQFMVQRDTESPQQMNQNLFRTYLYLNSSPMFDWLTMRGGALWETGPFTDQNLHSRDGVATLEFEVGRPWGRNSMITGYYVRDLLFRPLVREFFTTSTWGGLQHKFGENLRITVLATYIRSWRVQDLNFTIAQALVPGARFEYKINKTWSVSGAGYVTRGEGFDIYNNVQSGFLVTYTKGLRRKFDDGSGVMSVDYPMRFSVGMQQQSFYNFPGSGTSNFRPVVNLSFF